MKKTTSQIFLTFISVFLMSSVGAAYLELNETADLITEGNYRIGVAPQVLLSSGGGTNVGAYVDFFLAESFNSRVALGGGTTDFWTSASVKWVPFPDYEKQPAIGLRGALIYARDANLNFYDVQLTPIISKATDTRYGRMTPYIGVPVTMVYVNSSNVTASQFVVGNEWLYTPEVQIGAELELMLSNTVSAFSVYVNFPFDGKAGFKK